MRKGVIYSLVLSFIAACVLAGFLLPLLIFSKGFSTERIICLFLFFFLFRADFVPVRQWLSIRWTGWKLLAVRTLVFAAAGALFALGGQLAAQGGPAAWVLCVVLAALFPALMVPRLKLKGAFLHDVEQQGKARVKYAAWMLGSIIPKKPRHPKRKTLLFRRSGRIFRKRTAENVLAEACIKSFFRNSLYGKTYLQITFFSMVAVLLIPRSVLVVKLGVWLVSGLLIGYYAKLYWREADSREFMQLFHWEEGVRFLAMGKALYYIMLPGYLCITAAAGFTGLSWEQALLLLPSGMVWASICSKIFTITGGGTGSRMDTGGRFR